MGGNAESDRNFKDFVEVLRDLASSETNVQLQKGVLLAAQGYENINEVGNIVSGTDTELVKEIEDLKKMTILPFRVN